MTLNLISGLCFPAVIMTTIALLKCIIMMQFRYHSFHLLPDLLRLSNLMVRIEWFDLFSKNQQWISRKYLIKLSLERNWITTSIYIKFNSVKHLDIVAIVVSIITTTVYDPRYDHGGQLNIWNYTYKLYVYTDYAT